MSEFDAKALERECAEEREHIAQVACRVAVAAAACRKAYEALSELDRYRVKEWSKYQSRGRSKSDPKLVSAAQQIVGHPVLPNMGHLGRSIDSTLVMANELARISKENVALARKRGRTG